MLNWGKTAKPVGWNDIEDGSLDDAEVDEDEITTKVQDLKM
jgi:hypothetical protein